MLPGHPTWNLLVPLAIIKLGFDDRLLVGRILKGNLEPC